MEILKNSQFLKLWGNQILLQIAFNMCNFTALLLINQLTGSRFALAQFYAAMTIPAFLFGFVAGAVVDVTDRKRLMLITDLLLSVLFFGYATMTHDYWGILLIAFATASVAQFFTPAEAATIPLLATGESLEHANALFLFTGLGSIMVGYAIAGPIIQAFGGISGNGPRAAFLIAGTLTGLGFFLRLSMRHVQTAQEQLTGQKLVARTLLMIKEVLKEAHQNNKISLPIAMLTLMEFNTGMLAILFIDYVNTYLKLPTTATSYFLVLPLIAGLGIGVAILGLLEKWWQRGHTILFGVLAFGVMIFALGLCAKFFILQTNGFVVLRLLTMIAAGIIGVAAVFIAVHSRTILQENTPEVMLGRVFSLVTVAASAVTPVPILLISLLTQRLDVTTVFVLYGGSLIVLGTLLSPLLRKQLV